MFPVLAKTFRITSILACRSGVPNLSATIRRPNHSANLASGINWFLGRDGIGSTNLFEAGGFVRTRSDLKQPNLQYHFMAIARITTVSAYGTRMPTKQ